MAFGRRLLPVLFVSIAVLYFLLSGSDSNESLWLELPEANGEKRPVYQFSDPVESADSKTKTRAETDSPSDSSAESRTVGRTPLSPLDLKAKKPYTLAFYNVYANGSNWEPIVKAQTEVVRVSGLLDKLDRVYYVSIGPDAGKVRFEDNKYENLRTLEKGAETVTLGLVWEHCRARPQDRVLYFHDKGSFDGSKKNQRLRLAMDCFVLSPGCLGALDQGFDTCGMRVSPFPHLHHPGNFFWAKCGHVRELVDPRSFENNSTFKKDFDELLVKQGIQSCVGPYVGAGRYFAESWVGTRPDFKPADCIDTSIDTSYAYNYGVPNSKLEPYCPNFKSGWSDKSVAGRKWGGQCGNASMLAHADLFRKLPLAPQPDPPPDKVTATERCTGLKFIAARSKLFYGKDADLMKRWRGLYGQVRTDI